MAIASLQGTLLMYTMEKADVTSRLTTIMSRLTLATQSNTELMEKTNEKRNYYAGLVQDNPQYADTTEYKTMTKAVEDDYQLQLSEIHSWETSLQEEKNSLETRLKVITTYEENWTSMLKNNVKKDFSYGQQS